MSQEVKISVRNLSKVFMRHQRQRTKGVSTEGLSALFYLLKKVFTKKQRDTLLENRNSFLALDGITFDVKAGDVLGIIGRNGAGKSTLLKILARVLNPSAGQVTIKGKVMSMLELGVGFAPDLTVRENIQIQGRLAGITPKEIQRVEENILNFAELTEFRDVPLGKCPSGSSAQLGFSAMINFNVEIILADEVLAVGDARFRQACEERVKAAGKSGEAVLFVSHDMNAIRRVCNRVIWIDKGKIIKSGPTDEVVQAYTAELLAGRLLPPLTERELAGSCRLLDLRLLDSERAQVGALQITEAGYLDCLLQISRPDVSITLQIELWQHKRCVFFAESKRTFNVSKATTFSIRVKIPGNLLNELPYQAKCRIYTHPNHGLDLTPILIAEEKLDILVMNSRPHESVWVDWLWAKPGIISPKLLWAVTLEN